jgi:hypothetical protein
MARKWQFSLVLDEAPAGAGWDIRFPLTARKYPAPWHDVYGHDE